MNFKKKNINFEVLENLICNEMDLDDFKGVAKILQEDYNNNLINPNEYAYLIDCMSRVMRSKLARC